MADRLLVFANDEVQKLLKERFVAVAADDWYQRRRKDQVGKFFAKVVDQSPRKGNHTKQGHYVFTATGKLLGFNNNRGAEKRLKMMKEALAKWEKLPQEERAVEVAERGKSDEDFARELPEGGQIIKVYTRCLEERDGKWVRIPEMKIGNLAAVDHLWLQEKEVKELGKLIENGGGEVPKAVSLRIAKFHLVDNTRGEPRAWKKEEVKEWSLSVEEDGDMLGSFLIESADQKLGYRGLMAGKLKVAGGKLTHFDLVIAGKHWGEGRFTRGARPGKTPLGQVFRLSDGKRASDRIPPQGIRWAPGYWNPEG